MVYAVDTQGVKGSTIVEVSPVLCESPISFIKPRMSSAATSRIAPPRVRQSPVCMVGNSILNHEKKKSEQHGSRAASKTPTKSVQRASGGANSRKSQRHHVIAAVESSSSSSSSFSEEIVNAGSSEMPYTIYQTIHEAINEVVPMAIHKALESLTQQLQQQHLSNRLTKQKKGSASAPAHVMQKCTNEQSAPAIVAPVVEAVHRAPTPPPPQIGQHHYYARPTQPQPNYHLQPPRDNRPQTPFHYNQGNERAHLNNMNAVPPAPPINQMPYYQYAPHHQAPPAPQQTPLYDNYLPHQPFNDYMGLYSSPFNNLACPPPPPPPQAPQQVQQQQQQQPNNINNNPNNFAGQYDGMLMNNMYQPGSGMPFYPTIFV